MILIIGGLLLLNIILLVIGYRSWEYNLPLSVVVRDYEEAFKRCYGSELGENSEV